MRISSPFLTLVWDTPYLMFFSGGTNTFSLKCAEPVLSPFHGQVCLTLWSFGRFCVSITALSLSLCWVTDGQCLIYSYNSRTLKGSCWVGCLKEEPCFISSAWKRRKNLWHSKLKMEVTQKCFLDPTWEKKQILCVRKDQSLLQSSKTFCKYFPLVCLSV